MSTHQQFAPLNTPGVCEDSTPLSERLWGIDWRTHLPFRSGELTVEASSYAEAAGFVAAHYSTIFQQETGPSGFSSSGVGEFKARYYAAVGDFFEVKRAGETVGLLVCNPADWSTYYVRSAALLPELQGHGVIQKFLAEVIFEVLREAGVERVDIDVAPSNLAMMHIATRLRCNATGTLLSERWGALVHFTRFLTESCERIFLQQFCAGPQYQLREPRARESGRSVRSAEPSNFEQCVGKQTAH
jgi:ribosomal protein S18 acetylase RimI-like enzyme